MIQGVIEILSEDAAACAAVGRNKADTKPKFYWVQVGENESTPYVCMAILSNQPNQVKDIVSSLDSVTFGAYTYASTPEKTDEISRAMRLAMEGQHWMTEDVEFDRIFLINQQDGIDKEAQRPFRLDTYTAIIKRPATT